jgi:hypothetical protein
MGVGTVKKERGLSGGGLASEPLGGIAVNPLKVSRKKQHLIMRGQSGIRRADYVMTRNHIHGTSSFADFGMKEQKSKSGHCLF